jgi:hypothetical protein
LEDRQLLMFLDGECPALVGAHLEQCPYCRERSRKLAGMQNYLTTQLYRLTCPTSIELGDYVLGMLPAKQSESMAVHVQDCPHCTQEVSQLKDYLGDLALAPRANPLEQVKVLIARLIGEIGTSQGYGGMAFAPAYATLRGGPLETITLQADGILIVLEVQPSDTERVAIIGQLNADEQDGWTGAAVELYQAGALLSSVSIDDLGAFRFEGILPGSTEIKIIRVRGPVVLANIEIVV